MGTVMLMVGLLVAAGVLSAILTGLVRQYALKKNVMDVANERSMHKVPTPRGGGLAIAVVFLLGVLIQTVTGWLPWNQGGAILFAGSIIAAIGWWDDKVNLPSKVRFLVQIITCAGALWILGGVPQIIIGSTRFDLGIWGSVIAVPCMVWMINLYNFMDGIDGFSASEAVLVGGFIGGCLLWSGSMLAGPAFFAAAASLGFLVWNWPPAKIFMGDVGSAFLGAVFAVLAVASMNEAAAYPKITMPGLDVFFIALGYFFLDSTLTLISRMINREKWTDPHRSHAFQRQARLRGGHLPVTLSVMFLNLAFLFPLAFVSYTNPDLAWIMILIASVPVALLVMWARGGIKPPVED